MATFFTLKPDQNLEQPLGTELIMLTQAVLERLLLLTIKQPLANIMPLIKTHFLLLVTVLPIPIEAVLLQSTKTALFMYRTTKNLLLKNM
jgi:hypothetical protein